MPWGPEISNTVVTNSHGWITQHGYLAQWTLTTLTDVKKTLEYLAYLGYMYEHDNQLSAIHVTREKRIDLEKRQTGRSVFQCRVFGPKGVGKTVFMQGLLGRNLQYLKTLNKEHFSRHAINLVHVRGQERYLVLHEVDVGLSDTLTTADLSCDVACLLYDVTNPCSFEYCARLYQQYFAARSVPVLIVGCKAEHHAVAQDFELQPDEFCRSVGLPPPQLVSCLDRINRDIYVKLTTMAVYPHEVSNMFSSKSSAWFKAGIGLAILASLGLLLLRYVRLRT
jgi:Ras family protein T1